MTANLILPGALWEQIQRLILDAHHPAHSFLEVTETVKAFQELEAERVASPAQPEKSDAG